ncbi:MAG TPA: class F sortase [Candidatus Saccharimonadales bacterium]|nr:class F sortase [Candidatus Saccharimonadales bacterium]
MASLVPISSKSLGSHSNLPKEVATQPLPETVNYGLPVRLKIPKLAVDAAITYVGLTKTGDMAAPTNISDVAWYKNGSLPGNTGSAVLAGHLDGARGVPGVFASLNKLQKGDTLQVIDSKGTVISFTVRETRTYGEDVQPKEVFNAVDTARLNLITCAGAWDTTHQHYQKRLVIFADKTG